MEGLYQKHNTLYLEKCQSIRNTLGKFKFYNLYFAKLISIAFIIKFVPCLRRQAATTPTRADPSADGSNIYLTKTLQITVRRV
ncbi:MAG: hypothetical protein AAB874_01805 [Patescibacteria group bacterium]